MDEKTPKAPSVERRIAPFSKKAQVVKNRLMTLNTRTDIDLEDTFFPFGLITKFAGLINTTLRAEGKNPRDYELFDVLGGRTFDVGQEPPLYDIEEPCSVEHFVDLLEQAHDAASPETREHARAEITELLKKKDAE